MSGLFGIISKNSVIDPSVRSAAVKIYADISRLEKHCSEVSEPGFYFCSGNLVEDKLLATQGSTRFLIEGEIFIKKEELDKINPGKVKDQLFNHNTLLPELYMKFGKDFVNHIKGVYNLAILDTETGECLVCNDVLGLKPLYYFENDTYIIFSSELRYFFHFSFIDKEINKIALIEYILFNIPLGDNTFLKKARLMKPATIYCRAGNTSVFNQYFDHLGFYHTDLLNEKQSLNLLNERFKESVGMNIPGEEPYYLSVTGGFDGRTVLSVINDYQNLRTYTFGAEESSDIAVAREIAERMGINHEVFLIDDNYYRDHFHSCSDELIMRTDALSTFERSHYLYAFRQIGKNSRVALSGNGGSEIFRVFYRAGALISPLFLELLLQTGDFRYVLLQFLSKSPVKYFISNFNNVLKEELVESVTANLKPYFSIRKNKGMNLFLLLETMRKYFGIEMKAESAHAINRSPYLDLDFLFALNQTPFSSAYQKSLTKNPIQRKKGQMVYAYIMEKNNLELAKINTNRGYAPHDVYKRLNNIKILLPYYYKFIKKQENLFNPGLTTKNFYDRYMKKEIIDNNIIDFPEIEQLYLTHHWRQYKRDLAKVVSWSYWYNKNTGVF